MNHKRWVALFGFVCISLWASLGDAATLTLQHGVAGYSGCTDSYIGSGGKGDDSGGNFGECDTLIVNSEHYNAG